VKLGRAVAQSADADSDAEASCIEFGDAVGLVVPLVGINTLLS